MSILFGMLGVAFALIVAFILALIGKQLTIKTIDYVSNPSTACLIYDEHHDRFTYSDRHGNLL